MPRRRSPAVAIIYKKSVAPVFLMMTRAAKINPNFPEIKRPLAALFSRPTSLVVCRRCRAELPDQFRRRGLTRCARMVQKSVGQARTVRRERDARLRRRRAHADYAQR